MDKHTNPFHAFAGAISTLGALGVNPMHSGATCSGWTKEVLSIMVNRKYAGEGHYYVAEIHITEEGFKELVHSLSREEDLTVAREPHSDTFDMLSIELSSLLKIFCLVPKEPEYDLAPGGETL